MDVKHLVKCGLKFIKDKNYRFQILAGQGLFDSMPDEEYVRKLYKAIMGVELDLENPKTFSAKNNWLKLYDRRDLYTVISDKVLAKDYVAKLIGEEYIIPTLGVWDSPDEIDFDALPETFVIKCNHNSGTGMYICKDKSKLDVKKVKRGLKKGLKEDYYLPAREWQYKNIKRKIIAEKFMEDSVQDKTKGLVNYKFYCFNGKVELLHVSQGVVDHTGARVSFVSKDWEPIPIARSDYKPFEVLPPKPSKFDEMLGIAEKLSENIPFVRIDLYEVDGQVYFSEFTLRNTGGFMKFDDDEWDYRLGALLPLPDKGEI